MARGTEEEEQEVRSLLSRHRCRIVLDLKETDLLAVLVKNAVLSASEEDLFKGVACEVGKGGSGTPDASGSDPGDHGVSNGADAEVREEKCDSEVQCSRLIELIAKSGFDKFKQFCYAIENECPQLIEDLINDRLKYDSAVHPLRPADTRHPGSANTTSSMNITAEMKDADIVADSDKDISDRSQRSMSYGGSINITPPVAAPRKGVKSISPILTNMSMPSPSTPEIPLTKLPPDQVNLNQKIDTISKLNQSPVTSTSNNYSSLLCHSTATTSSPVTVRKRDKILHRFSDAATIGRKLRKKKNNNRSCRSMAEPIEVLADPVVEDDFFTDRTSWEYHTVAITRVPGYGFGIAVSGGRDNPHFANGDPSIAVSDVLKGGPAEERLQVNDRIISVNGVSLENVEYATAVQVLRDSGNTVTLVVKRRVPNLNLNSNQHSHSMSAVGLTGGVSAGGGILTATIPPVLIPGQPIKLALTKASKKEDFGIVLGCRLFIKEITSKARDQLAANGYSLQEGDVITRINNTNCSDSMSMKEAKKIIDGCKERLNLVVLRDVTNQNISNNNLNNSGHQASIYAHAQQLSSCSNNLDEAYLNGTGPGYSSQNLYVQPPTRGITSPLVDEKNNLTPRGRSRGPLTDVSLSQLDRPSTPPSGSSPRRQPNVDDPPRPPPPRNEEFYSSRRQLYEEDPLQRSRQSAEPRFISFQKEGSVGIRLTGGNEAGIFVTAVQPGSPASLQGLTPGDKILKVNDMDMHGVTREEAVLFLLSLQDRIDLIVQHCKEEYDEVVANQRGDSFHIKTHFHCENPSKGEMVFKAGDVFRVIDTLHNGVVGSWQVLRIGRGHQEMQRGVIPNKSRAEELATAQFNATKKEMNASESRGNFFRRRRSTHRRSKSLSRENWDDVVFSDSISKFAAYERVVLRHPGFVRPVVLFGPVADLAREKLAKDFPDKFTAPLQDDDKSNAKCRIVRLSNIRDIMDRGKHALLDITPNAVDRLNYAQFYPIVLFLKTDSKHVIKQLRRDVPKAAHKSSKKLLEQCGKLDKVWSHIFSTTIVLNETDSWYRKLRDAIDLQQSGAVWMSESKPVESLSDDFLFPMTTSRLSYASSPESDLELSPGPSTSLSLGNLPQLVKSSSDPSIATNQDNLDGDRDIGEGLPPYAQSYNQSNMMSANHRGPIDSKFGFAPPSANQNQSTPENTVNRSQPIYGMHVPDLPPRIDRASKPPGGVAIMSAAVNNQMRNSNSSGTLGRSAQERLFGKQGVGGDDGNDDYATRTASNSDSIERNAQSSLDRQRHNNVPGSGGKGSAGPPQPLQNGSYDSVSSYDSYNTTQLAAQNIRLGPNAPDDLKSVPSVSTRIPPPTMGTADYRDPNRNAMHDHARNMHEHAGRGIAPGGPNDLNRQSSPGRPLYDVTSSRNIDNRNPHDPRTMNIPQRPSHLGLESSPRKQIVETKTDYGKYSRNNSTSQADYAKSPKLAHMSAASAANGNMNSAGNMPFKPVPPPKPKNYRPPIQGHMNASGHWDNGEPTSPRSPNGFFYPPNSSHYHHSQGASGSPHNAGGPPHPGHGYGHYSTGQQPPYPTSNGYNAGAHPYGAGPGSGQYMHRGHHPMANAPPHHTPERHALDLAGSREQRGSAFELYRKPQIGTAGHHHNLSDMEPFDRHYHHSNQNYNHQYQHHSPPLPPSSSSMMYANSTVIDRRNYQNYYFEDARQAPPPLPPPLRLPPKAKKKSLLRSPLAAIKNAFMKSTRPLRRMNSMVEPERKIKPCLRRQYSLMERPSRVHYAPDSYHHASSLPPDQRHNAVVHHEPFYPQHLNMTYQNLEHEDIYTSRDNKESFDDLYANRALIDLERRNAESNAGRRIVRRHSMADRTNQRSTYPESYDPEDIYQSRHGAYMMHERRAPGSAVMVRRRFYTDNIDEPVYQSRREMHRHHLYQSRKEMQERIAQGKKEIEREFTPQSSSNHSTETEDRSDREPIYQSRREVKDNGYKTRAQLREQIYQSRREAMESMAEPIYVSKRELRHEPIIFESREEGAAALVYKENETDEKKEKEIRCESSVEDTLTTSKNSDLQNSNETVIENERFDDPSCAKMQNPTPHTSTSDESELRIASTPPVEAPSTPRSLRTPFHISNIIKRTAPVIPMASSRTSLETHYTSQASLPVGPPNASSTPYTSDMSLPGGAGPHPGLASMQPIPTPPPTPREPSTTRGVIDERGGTLFDNVWNVSLSIPPGAIPAGVKQEVYFTVSDPRLSEAVGGPPLDMENGETMLSPLVMCGPQGLEFLVPVTLNIPHCAGRTASLGLALKATDSEKNLQTNWDNIDLPSNAAAHTVSVKVDHF